jgi:hypothetical protein
MFAFFGGIRLRISAWTRRGRLVLLGAILVFCLGVAELVAGSFTFVCSDTDCGSYTNHSITVTTTNGTLSGVCGADSLLLAGPPCTSMPWWGDSLLGRGMATSLGFQSEQPKFVYSSLTNILYSAWYVPSTGSPASLTIGIGATDNFVTGFTDNGVPEIDQGSFYKAMLLLVLILFLLRYRDHPHYQDPSS